MKRMFREKREDWERYTGEGWSGERRGSGVGIPFPI